MLFVSTLSRSCRQLVGAASLALMASIGMVAMVSPAAAEEEVNVYSYRQPFLVKPLFDAFTEETGINVNMVYAKQGLVERLKAEGAASPADVVLTSNVTRLVQLVENDLVQPIASDVLEENVPANFRDPAGLWFGLTMRGRVIYASKERVPEGAVETYEDLADPKWKGKVCTRKGDHDYNLDLIAAMIARNGQDETKVWLEGVKANLARKPQGNDRAQVQAIYQGLCDLSLGNTYYMGKMLSNPDQKAWAEAAYIVFPNQDSGGTHVNISGAAVTKAAPHKDNAVKLLEFLSGEKAQEIYADVNYEYPVKPGVPWSPTVKAWGEFKADTQDLADIVALRPEALTLVNETGFNAGP